jgi:hypothetical protein
LVSDIVIGLFTVGDDHSTVVCILVINRREVYIHVGCIYAPVYEGTAQPVSAPEGLTGENVPIHKGRQS